MSLLDADAEIQAAPSLDFQDFGSVPTSAGAAPSTAGGIGSSMLKPASMASLDSDDHAAGNSAANSGFWTLRYYQPLFDVDTVQVLMRIKGSMLPRPRGFFFDLISQNPDLWGPFWISTTLIFAVAITGNLASYYAYHGPAGKWSYNFNHLTLAGSVVYSYVTVLPILLWLLLRYYDASKRLIDIICIYGYTLGIFIPISVLCVLNSDILRWFLILVGGSVSGLFLVSNMHAHLSDCFPYGEGDAKRKMVVVLGGMAGCHVLLMFLFKMFFFHYTE